MEVKFINGKKLPGGYKTTSTEAIYFDSQEQLDSFIVALQAANDGSTEPIIKPDGTTLRPISNGEKWFWEQMAMINVYLMLLFSGMR